MDPETIEAPDISVDLMPGMIDAGWMQLRYHKAGPARWTLVATLEREGPNARDPRTGGPRS